VEGTQAVLDAARRTGVRRFIHMSALGTRPDAPSRYHQTKFQAEQAVRQSGLDWTIFRPSLIHGPTGEFMQMELAWVAGRAPPFLFMPYFGPGLFGRGAETEIQPVLVEDVARAFVDALDRPQTIGQVYPLGGSERITWASMHRTVARAVRGRARLVLPIPAWWALLLTRLVPAPLLPFNRDQVVMSQQPNTCDMTPFIRDFGFKPEGFSAALARYVQPIHDTPAH
jgi:NADH dehydrogenase